jgi:DNA-binding GntR family transcriptional regulator
MDISRSGSPPPRLNLRTRTDEIRDAIEERIGTGDFPPGMRLDQRSLAQFFSVSRTPLREALIQLCSIGIASIRPRRGIAVPEFSTERLLEMFEVMAEFEAMVARHAARRMSDAERLLVVKTHEDSRPASEAEDVDDYWNQVERFHMLLYTCSHSSFLAEQTSMLFRRIRAYRRLDLQSRARIRQSFRERSAIVDALVSANANLAADRLRRHVFIEGDRFTDLLAAVGRIRRNAYPVTIPSTRARGPRGPVQS